MNFFHEDNPLGPLLVYKKKNFVKYDFEFMEMFGFNLASRPPAGVTNISLLFKKICLHSYKFICKTDYVKYSQYVCIKICLHACFSVCMHAKLPTCLPQ